MTPNEYKLIKLRDNKNLLSKYFGKEKVTFMAYLVSIVEIDFLLQDTTEAELELNDMMVECLRLLKNEFNILSDLNSKEISETKFLKNK